MQPSSRLDAPQDVLFGGNVVGASEFMHIVEEETCGVGHLRSETTPGEDQNLFATLTVRTYVWLL